MVEYTKLQQAANRAKLTTALYSGDFLQSVNKLKTINARNKISYCVLGVASELYRRDNPDTSFWDGTIFVSNGTIGKAPQIILSTVKAELTPHVRDWLGFRTTDGLLVYKDKESSLIELNDEHLKTFIDLAVIIETNETLLKNA